ncbi:MAG TPA: hypothetical protein VF491_26390 [Vicinamibacterales bacterium]|jgi:hypothetical protein
MRTDTSAGTGLAFQVHTLAAGNASAAEMRAWKSVVDMAVRTGASLSLRYNGAANAITSYRLYFMLQYAKEAGVGRLSCHLRTTHWSADAKEWLQDSPADVTTVD